MNLNKYEGKWWEYKKGFETRFYYIYKGAIKNKLFQFFGAIAALNKNDGVIILNIFLKFPDMHYINFTNYLYDPPKDKIYKFNKALLKEIFINDTK